jgi:hypothetical protein
MTSRPLPLFFDTRSAAHARIAPSKQEIYARILGFARWRGHRGLTADELAAAWHCDHNHVAPRISELKKSGQLIPTKHCRPTRAHSLARVFVASEFAELAFTRYPD